MSYNPLNPNGQAAMANSQPIVIASNQSPVSVAGTLNITGTPSVSGTVGANLISSNASVISVPQGSVATVIIGGSIAASFTPPANQSVSGAVSVSNFPTTQNVSGSVVGFQGTSPWVVNFQNSSIIATPTGNQSVSGTINILQLAGSILATSATVSMSNSSVMLLNGANTIGSVTALQGTNPYVMTGSVQGTMSVLGTVPVTQSTSPWIITGSIQGAISASVFQQGTWTPSAIGYLYRNDTVASTLGADQTYHPIMGDAAGRLVTKPFSSEDGTIISYTGSIVSGSVQLIQASVIGKKSYVTDFWISNTGATTTLVTFQGGDTSVLGKFIAPTGGGMASPGISIPLKTTTSQDLAFTVTPSTSVLYLSLKGYQAQ